MQIRNLTRPGSPTGPELGGKVAPLCTWPPSYSSLKQCVSLSIVCVELRTGRPYSSPGEGKPGSFPQFLNNSIPVFLHLEYQDLGSGLKDFCIPVSTDIT